MSWMDKYASLYPNYQQGAQQQGAIWSNAIQQLAQMASQYQQKKAEDDAVQQWMAGGQVNVPAQYAPVPTGEIRQIVNPGATATWSQPQQGAQFTGIDETRTAQSNAVANNPFSVNRMEQIAPATTRQEVTPTWLRQGLSSPFARVREAAQIEHLLSKEENPQYTLGPDDVRYKGGIPIAIGVQRQTGKDGVFKELPTGKIERNGGMYRESVNFVDPKDPSVIRGSGFTDWKPEPQSSQSSQLISNYEKWKKDNPSDYQSVVDSVAKGRVKMSGQVAGRFSDAKVRQQFTSDVLKVNPDYEEYTYDNDKTYKAQYNPSGRIGLKIANLNTAVVHTKELLSLVDSLGNNEQQLVNDVRNWFANKFGTKRAESLNSFESVKAALSGELGGLFKGGNAAATDPEIDNISKIIDSAQKPTALKSALVDFLKVGKQRIDQFTEPYNTRFEENKDFLTYQARKALSEYGLISNGYTGGQTNSNRVQRRKPLEEMTNEELIEYEKSLTGGK